MGKTKIKIGLALGGGSALGLAHLGVIKALEENNIKIDCLSGTSVGAVICALYAFGIPLESIVERAKHLSWYNLSDFSYSKMGLATVDGMGKLLEEILGDVRIEQAKIPLAINTTNIKNGEKVIIRKGPVGKAVMASVCVPGLFVPVKISRRALVDGALVENLPLDTLDEFQADLKIGVNLVRWRPNKEPHNVIDVMLNTMDIMTNRQTHEDDPDTILIEPHLEKYNPSDFSAAPELFEIGYQSAKKMMPKILEGLKKAPKSNGEEKLNFWLRFLRWINN